MQSSAQGNVRGAVQCVVLLLRVSSATFLMPVDVASRATNHCVRDAHVWGLVVVTTVPRMVSALRRSPLHLKRIRPRLVFSRATEANQPNASDSGKKPSYGSNFEVKLTYAGTQRRSETHDQRDYTSLAEREAMSL